MYLGYDDMKKREASGEDVMGNNERKWMKRFEIKNPYLDEIEDKENFKENRKDKSDDDKEKPDILEIDEEEDKKREKYREGKKSNPLAKIGKTIEKGIKKTILKPITKFFNKIIKPIIYIFDSVECGVKKIENLFVCAKWYFLQLLGVFLYFPYRILFYITGTTKYENTMWKYIEKGDSFFYDYTGYHFAHFQDDVVNLCYKCCKK